MKPNALLLVRIVWLALPLTLVPALDGALDDRSAAIALLVSMAAWIAWAVGVVAVLAPRTLSLTYLRVMAPASLVVACWAALDGATALAGGCAVALTAVTAVVVLAPATADALVNGSAYGPERRFALRLPGALLFGPVVLVWLLVVVGTATGPLLLAAEQWVPGTIALVVGLPLAAAGCRSLHQLARRWLVFVPAGLVVHDPTAMASQLLPRAAIRSIRPALADSTAHDLTAGAPGLALEVQLVDPITIEPPLRRRARSELVETDRFLVAPGRPGAVVREAKGRRIPVV